MAAGKTPRFFQGLFNSEIFHVPSYASASVSAAASATEEYTTIFARTKVANYSSYYKT